MAQESAGRVVNITLSGDLLLAAPPTLKAKEAMGAFLVDARLESVARVSEIIGPVSAPTIVAAPKPGTQPHRLVGRDLYLSPPRPPRKDSRSKPRRFRGGR